LSVSESLKRLVGERLDDCCDADVAARVETLREYRASEPTDANDDLAALSALGSDTRYAVVRLLATADSELCVCEIEPVVDVSESAVSHALSTLHDAGLVARRKEGRWRYYETTPRADALLAALDGTRGGR
jgi:DNA-binding transcriptional ArsR family regulator